ncbi:MAG TPA: alpha/beta hydrolase [Ilumatobacteraceae bacterium]|nr:alpha/beta hydrolase [Ilumatobacteraceae bacterium]
MSTSRDAYELELDGGIVVRGIRIDGGTAARLVLLHDIGHDLDEFGRLPEALAALGCDVLAVDLPGHGVSDDPPDPAAVPALAVQVLREVRDDVPLGLVASGRTATVGVMVGRPQGVESQVLINPVLDENWLAGGRREHAIRLVMHAERSHLVGTETQRFIGRLIGEKMLLHHPGIELGPASIAQDSTPLTHLSLFVQRYLIAQLRGGFPHVAGRR